MDSTISASGAGLSLLDLDAPACAVTLMEDRARVTRRGSLQLPAGRHCLRVSAVAPVLVDKSLVVVAQPDALGLKVIDARVVRRLVQTSQGPVQEMGEATAERERTAVLRRERDALERELLMCMGALARLEGSARSLLQIGRLTLDDAVVDVSYGTRVPEGLHAELTELRGRYRGMIDEIADAKSDLVDKRETLARLETRIAMLESPADSEWACLEIDVEATSAVQASFQIDYAVPSACWRPYHRARLVTDEGVKVEFRTDACVWQNTGEDWREVELTLSTERSSLGLQAPTLTTDSLQSQRKSSAVHIEAREQSVESVPDEPRGAGGAEMPGIDDGGQALHIRAQQRCTLPSDGRPHRLFLREFVADAETELVAMPELHASVLLASTFENLGEMPLLAGPVDLVRESGLIGRTKILYVATGERFELGWGPNADLRVRREVEESAESTRALSAWNAKTHSAIVKVSNLGQHAHTLRVVERVPVSEIDKVKIEVDKKATTGAKGCDVNGFVEWTLELAPHSHQAIELHYTVKKHDDVVG